MMRQDILCRGIVRVSRVCMHSNEPFIMGCVVCVRCVPPVDTTAHRVDKAPHPARRRAGGGPGSSPRAYRPELAVASAGNARGGPRAGPRRRPRDVRDRPRRGEPQRDLARKRFPTFRKMKDLDRRRPRRRRPACADRPRAAGFRGGARLAVLAPRFLARCARTKCHVDTRKVPVSFRYACGDAYALRIISDGGRRGAGPRARGCVPCECDLAPATYSCIDYEKFEPFAGAGPDVPCRLAPPM